MKAIQIHQYLNLPSSLEGDSANQYLSMNHNVAKPGESESPLKKNQMLVKVLACSISPGDVIMVQGNMKTMMHQPFPFVPGMDICGVVIDPNGSTTFQNGNVVVASNGIHPVGGMAEYMVVEKDECVLKPKKGVSVEAGASCSSAISARNAVMEHVKKGDRVLVLGGSGGVGSAAIQIAKLHAQASFVATTSTQTEFCQKLGADLVIDYRIQDWWQIMDDLDEKDENNKLFDVIIDTVGGGNFYGRAEKVAKTGTNGGTFVAVTGDDPKPDCTTTWKLIRFFARMLGRMLYTQFTRARLPKYVMLMPHSVPEGRTEVLEWIDNGSLTIPLDQDSPLPFTTQGVSKAFRKVASGHAHGKVVVKIANEYHE
eukprot:CAMPEP_0178926844 /NCGR_PEP_ID=MMETSP0786-20121207/18789_1 /TAXON_ID=186022 /ORGANISM="Thalassionema frauenfeldii, Strain CCMP 1798" /LENGTH=368 /DNA_ID=CAMNT_0020602073 /DNA_START=403 /DNA_END=1509 /DNA_ORIENTATION=+